MSRELNEKLLRRVRNHILAEPRRYDQTSFGRKSSEAPCGTAACIAGWADFLENKTDITSINVNGFSIQDRAAKALGLPFEDAKILFSGDASERWPKPFCTRYRKAKTAKGRASAAAAYLDHIIKTGKVTE